MWQPKTRCVPRLVLGGRKLRQEQPHPPASSLTSAHQPSIAALAASDESQGPCGIDAGNTSPSRFLRIASGVRRVSAFASAAAPATPDCGAAGAGGAGGRAARGGLRRGSSAAGCCAALPPPARPGLAGGDAGAGKGGSAATVRALSGAPPLVAAAADALAEARGAATDSAGGTAAGSGWVEALPPLPPKPSTPPPVGQHNNQREYSAAERARAASASAYALQQMRTRVARISERWTARSTAASQPACLCQK